MRMPTIETTTYLIGRSALAMLCLLAAANVASAQDSRRGRSSSLNRLRAGETAQLEKPGVWDDQDRDTDRQTVARDLPSDLEAARITFKPNQKLRKSGAPQRAGKTVRRTSHTSGSKAKRQQNVAQTSYQPLTAPCDNCGSRSCDGGCDGLAEPVCGLEAPCGCDSGGCDSRGCDSCGDACEPVCGIEAGCGFEQACAGSCRRPARLGRFNDPQLQNFTFRAEYLLWWMDGFSTPPLLTTSSAGTSIEDAGILGLPTTSVVFGNQSLTDGFRNGGRLALNYWFDCEQTRGIEAIYTGLATERETFIATSQQYPILARPFFNIEPGVAQQDAELIAYPGVLEGNARIEADSTLQGVEILYRHAICRDCNLRVDGLFGWRYNSLNEQLHFSDFKRVLGDDIGLPIGTTLMESDRFKTKNSFNGAELGIVALTCRCQWSLEGVMKLALGNNHSQVDIDGQATFIVPDGNPPVTNTPAGLLAQSTNIGRFNSNDFAVIPELGVTLGYDINCHWRATFGYTFLYWCSVARPGDQIDTSLNLTQLEATGLEGVARPQPTRALTDVWAQGLRFGLACRF